MPKKTVIDKATVDKPDHLPLDPDQIGVLVIRHDPTGVIIRTRGWTLRQVLFRMGWGFEDTWATYKRPWSKDRGAILLTPADDVVEGLTKLNSNEEVE